MRWKWARKVGSFRISLRCFWANSCKLVLKTSIWLCNYIRCWLDEYTCCLAFIYVHYTCSSSFAAIESPICWNSFYSTDTAWVHASFTMLHALPQFVFYRLRLLLPQVFFSWLYAERKKKKEKGRGEASFDETSWRFATPLNACHQGNVIDHQYVVSIMTIQCIY